MAELGPRRGVRWLSDRSLLPWYQIIQVRMTFKRYYMPATYYYRAWSDESQYLSATQTFGMIWRGQTRTIYIKNERMTEEAGLSQLLLPKAPVTQRRYLVLFISLKSDIDDNATIAVKTSERYAPMLNRFLCLSAETSWWVYDDQTKTWAHTFYMVRWTISTRRRRPTVTAVNDESKVSHVPRRCILMDLLWDEKETKCHYDAYGLRQRHNDDVITPKK